MHVLRTTKKVERAWLYQLVFHTPAIKIAVFFMIGFFAFQPAIPALANEPAPDTQSEESSSAASDEPSESSGPEQAEPEPEPRPEVVEEVASPAEASTSDTTAVESLGAAESITAPEAAPEDGTETAEVSPETSGGTGVDDVSTAEPVPEVDTPTDSATPPSSESPVSDDTESGSGSDTGQSGDGASLNEEVTIEEVASTTVPEPQYFEVTGELSHTDDTYFFSKTQCLSMGAGAYHCFDPSAAMPAEEAETLYVARDDDGDKEIFLRTTGGVEQVTSNRVDDDAPYFDPVSNSIVWHQDNAGVFRVMELQNGMETVLSLGFGTSMEPHRAGRYTVWQSWVEDRWQIVLDDGQGARVISEGAGQHIAPQVEGSYVLWNVTNGDTHTVAVYELSSGLVSYIDDGEGARVMNPRFVLVYDTRFDNGDVITKGYDTETGDVVPLAAAAPVQPTEVPSADPTGETRALLQNKTYSRDEFSEGEDMGTASGSTTGTTTPGVAVGTTTLAVPALTEAPPLPLTDFDLIVEPYQAASSSQP